mgnify:CR=1 FL=1
MSRFRPVISERLPSRTHFAELFLAPGPERIGVTGDNAYATMFGFDWLLVWDRDDGLLHLFQERDGAWQEVTEDLPPVFASPVPVGARRWSLAFDQAARVILAYEDGAGIVRVTRWEPSSNSYVQNVSFSGRDPVVVMDASWSYAIPGSDVLLFHLSSDRERVLCRVQRDIYAVEHEIWDYGTPVILDRVIALPYKYQILVSDSTGTPLPDVLVSDLYPVTLSVGVELAAEFVDGEYRQTAYAYAPLVGVEVTAEFVSGALQQPVVIYAPSLGVQLAAEFASGELRNVVTKYQPSLTVQLTAEFVGGALDEIGIPYTPPLGVELSAEFIGGAYEPG